MENVAEDFAPGRRMFGPVRALAGAESDRRPPQALSGCCGRRQGVEMWAELSAQSPPTGQGEAGGTSEITHSYL